MSNNAPDYENDLVFPPQEIKSQHELTEQWKKGELESGKEYWVRLTDEWKNSIEQVYFNGEDFELFDIDDIEEVLAPVPSYEEWKQLIKFLEEFNALDVAKENQQLKELLHSLKCCLTSQNIEPQIRVEKSLAKIKELDK